ncbi:MAG: hypothetical protein ABSF70_06205 [Terracidiphilus sp.]|jgi:hypothetical protein
MSVAVLCNLSDGVIIGVDSALSVWGGNGVQKVFEDGEKLFQLDKRIGIAAFGLAGLAGRSIGSFLYEFEQTHDDLGAQTIEQIVESLRAFFLAEYIKYAELVYEKPFDQIDTSLTSLGILVAGYSPKSFLSEAWEIRVPDNKEPGSARQVYKPGDYGLAWFAMSEPIERYLYGISIAGLTEIADYVAQLLARPLTQGETDKLLEIRRNQGYTVMTDSMPIKTGVDYVRFLVDYVITHYRFTQSHSIVGGKSKIGVITYRKEDFHIME